MAQKVIKVVAAGFAFAASSTTYGLTVTPIWQESGLLLIFIVILSMLILMVYLYQKKVISTDPRLALLWRHVPDIITEIDSKGRILTINRAALGFNEADLIGHSSFEFLTPEGQKVFARALDIAINQREPHSYELEINNELSGTLWISNRIIPIIEDRKIVTLLVITTDITEQKQAHSALLDLKQQAEQANLAKSQFLAGMSHEIRTPMTGMLGMVSLLEKTPLSIEQQEYVSTIQQSSEHLLAIINDVLDLSKIEAGKLSIENESLELDNFITSLVDMVGNRAREKGLNLQTFINEKVPNLIIADAVRLRQILMNFLTNAIKFTMKGHIILRIVPLQLKDSSVCLRFSVEDSGIGMSADKAAIIFDKYTHAHGQQSVQLGGTGLGLNISQRLAEMMSGRIGVVSTLNVGSNFWLDLDVAISSCDTGSSNGDRHDQEIKQVQGLTAWVLDEVKVNRLLMKAVAKKTGFNVREFNQLSTMLDEIESKDVIKPNFLVFSRELGAKKVNQLLTCMKKLDPNILLAMTTVEAINIDYDALQAQGIHAFWEWPLAQKELDSILSRLFAHDWQHQPNTLITRYQRSLIASHTQADCRGKVLLAEDNLVNQKVVAQMLKKMGFDVDVVVDGEAVIAAWKRQAYDVILMDCHMPVMDGIQATRMIRLQEDKQRIPILALTADVMTDSKAECLAAGMDDFMSKPIRMDELRRVITRFIK